MSLSLALSVSVIFNFQSKALVLTRLFLQMRHSLSNEVKKEFALNSDAILNCLSISKKAIENEEERNYQVIQFYRIVIQVGTTNPSLSVKLRSWIC